MESIPSLDMILIKGHGMFSLTDQYSYSMIRFPISLEIDITGRCNYRCLYCRNGNMCQHGDMSYKTIVELLDECEKCHVFSLSISGGEPTLHKHFFDIVSKLGSMDIRWSLTTNGSNIDNRLAEHLSKNKVQNVFITLSGFSESTESKHKGIDGCFHRTMQTIELCLQKKIPLTLGYLLTPLNKNELASFINFCKTNGIPAKLMKVEYLGDAVTNYPSLGIAPSEYTQTKELFVKELASKVILGEYDVAFEDRFCSAGVISCVVGFDGVVYPCVNFLGVEELGCGSITDNSLSYIWNNSPILQSFREPRLYAKACEACAKKTKCGGGCRAEAYRLTGSYKAIEQAPCNICTDSNTRPKSE